MKCDTEVDILSMFLTQNNFFQIKTSVLKMYLKLVHLPINPLALCPPKRVQEQFLLCIVFYKRKAQEFR